MIAGFFRHGPAVERGSSEMADEDRPLTPSGRKKTLLAARGLRRLDLGFERVLTSPLPRALQTAEILCHVLKLGKPAIDDRLLPGSAARRVLEILSGDGDATLLVGHEPDLSKAVLQAVGALGRESIELKKAGFALVRLEGAAPKPEGILTLLLTPSALRKLGRR
jgi:phosphohistidine phosphatase